MLLVALVGVTLVVVGIAVASSTGSANSDQSSVAAPSIPTGSALNKLVALGRANAAAQHEDAPASVEIIPTTETEAISLLGGLPFSTNSPAYLVAVRGKFTCKLCSVPPGVAAPTGDVSIDLVDATTNQVVASYLFQADRVPDIATLGPVQDVTPAG